MAIPVAPSPQLAAANQRLHILRAQAQAQRRYGEQRGVVDSRQTDGREIVAEAGEAANAVHMPNRTKQADRQQADLPPHLGWGSVPLTAVFRATQTRRGNEQDDSPWAVDWPQPAFAPKSKEAPVSQLSGRKLGADAAVKVYPDIALGMLRQEQAAAGRIWLLAHYLDAAGAGWLRIDIIRKHLTKKNSKLRVCGWRQLRNLLKQGEGIFWHRDKERLWLRSAAKVAYALNVTQLTGRPVGVPVFALVGGIGDARAHLYASFHSGRVKENAKGGQPRPGVWSPPIARDTLTAVSGVGRVSQRTYEARTKTKALHNFAVGETVEEVNRERRAWQQGQALFELKDYRGEQGRKGKTYLAWQLPNTYIGRHQQRPQGRQKRINRELKDLVMKGMPGNIEEKRETPETPELAAIPEIALTKRYYPNGKLAARAYGRQVINDKSDHELYWRRHRTGNGRFDVWQKLGGG
ncbi:MAG: hypothetical protein GY803_20390 [Chloroflexi bacterium]|nr:hypothetical protein [Chloroflexota bacterium]